jgi:hypothetical protein
MGETDCDIHNITSGVGAACGLQITDHIHAWRQTFEVRVPEPSACPS